jgi:DnaK suppressor protein
MNNKTPVLTAAFLETQRGRLMDLREQLEKRIDAGRAQEGAVNGISPFEAKEQEDDAQRLALLEVDGTLISGLIERLAQVKRALQKIEEGTYGVSDRSGKPIPTGRLEAMPEAIDSVSDQ